LFSPLHTPAPCSAAANGDTLTAGQELSVDDKLVSRNGKFALGFFTLQSGPSNMRYLAPEWLSGVAVTSKVDVYSLGMVLLEIISGKRNTPDQVYTSSNNQVACFPVQAILKLQGGDISSLVDPQLHGDFNLEEVERVCKVACWCIQDDESDRPTMGELLQVLEGLQELDMPPMPRLLAALTHGIL
ncbi:unnamed protein product, partial [Urochloa humidicola]